MIFGGDGVCDYPGNQLEMGIFVISDAPHMPWSPVKQSPLSVGHIFSASVSSGPGHFVRTTTALKASTGTEVGD